MSSHVFTYGSLTFDAVWSRVVVGRYRATPATLDDHARFAIRDESYPGMIATVGSRVVGVLHLDVDDGDLDRLDRFEGDDYLRTTVEVTGADGATWNAQTYLYLLPQRLLPTTWEPDAFAMQRFLDTYCRDRLA